MSSSLDTLCDAVTSPLVASLLETHPNDLAVSRSWPFRESWWEWAKGSSDGTDRWRQILEYSQLDSEARALGKEWDIPVELRDLIDQLTSLSLPRDVIPINAVDPFELSTRGMSPKKAHEVHQSVAYISNLLSSLNLDVPAVRIVDVGAGQGYLTRALRSHLGTTHLLALDSSEIQTRGAERWQERTGLVGSITQKTIHITPQTLSDSVDEWIQSSKVPSSGEPVPVLFVALHACGSLTPDILRAFFMQQTRVGHAWWKPLGVIAIGCCYNLLASRDFPLSTHLTCRPERLSLPISAFHLAAQMPSQWMRSPESRADAELALRKVVWRAIIGSRFSANVESDSIDGQPDGTGDRPVMRRLGRLSNAVYTDWETFVRAASDRLGAVFECGPLTGYENGLISELEVLHVLRCIAGPMVESLFIVDRRTWVQEQLVGLVDVQVAVVNLFDQGTGSGRNVALVVSPQGPRPNR
ncbi:unnamed protein product [Mycena citricolor]|uniref:Methyltransferase domain-containing protein n=1 Tax=Mycena citricolor TaxID=2018698 RepID=A0AAD2Q7B8_9AGAR|nr:unnamed protein product [Mycena citricolor]